MSVFQSLSVTEVAGSQNIQNNTSQVRIKWISTQTGESWNGYTKTAYYYVSINGGAEQTYSVTYTLPQTSTVTIADATITVKHKDDGTGVVSVRTWMDTGISAGKVEKSQTITLATIPRLSMPTLSASSIDIGKAITIYTNRQSKNFTHHIYYSVNGGAEVGITPGIEDSFTWTVPYSLLSNIPNDKQMTLTFRLYTFNGATNLGSQTISLKAYVPTNADTAPKITLKELKPISSLPSPFNALYIQGKSRVKVDFTKEALYGANITSCSVSVEGESYDSTDDYTSKYLSGYGSIAVTITATDTRGITGSLTQYIDVSAYSKPKIMALDSEDDIICARCDSDGNIADSGTYLKVKAKRSYSKVIVSGEQKNFCAIAVRYKSSTGGYSGWHTVLSKSDLSTNTVSSKALLDGALAVDTSYDIQVCAMDDLGEMAYATFHIPTDKVDSHEGKGFLALGRYSEKKNGFECDWEAEFYKDVIIRGGKLTDFVIEEGTEGIWSYRKWESGYAECWGTATYHSLTFSNTWGSLYNCVVNDAIPYPFTFVERPTEVAFARGNGYTCWVYPESNGRGVNTTTQTGIYGAVRPSKAESAVSIYLDISVKGRWK